MDPFRLRPARPDDYPALCALWKLTEDLHAGLLPGYFRRSPRPPRSREEVDKILRAPDELILVAEELEPRPRTIGLVHIQIYDTPPVPSMVPRRRAHVENLIVDAERRRRGVGRRLIAAASDWARRHGADELLLTVWEGNDAAVRFYESLGFGRVNTVLGRSI